MGSYKGRERSISIDLTVAQINAGADILGPQEGKTILVTGATMTPTTTPDTATGFYLEDASPKKATIKLTSANVNDTVTVNGISYTAKAATAVTSRQFINTDDTAAAAALVLCINDPAWGVPGVLATSSSGTVTVVSKQAVPCQVKTGVGGTRVISTNESTPVLVGEFLVGASLTDGVELKAEMGASGFTAGAGWEVPLTGGCGLKIVTHGTAEPTMSAAHFIVDYIVAVM